MLRGSCLLSSRDGVGQGKTVKVEKERRGNGKRGEAW